MKAEAPLVGLCGLAQSGKDTFAGYLGYRRIAFADPLKRLALACDPVFPRYRGGRLDEIVGLTDVVRHAGWEWAKSEVPGVRRFLQDLGVGVRDILGEDTWVDAAFRTYDPTVATVFTDVRFPNEIAKIRALGGVIVRIERHGQGSPDSHISEQAWKGQEPDHWFTFADGAFSTMERYARQLDYELQEAAL